tara:strand:- start:690 stop:827 length:138 start_codon:yes stop_codon:yes gene_type:complete
MKADRMALIKRESQNHYKPSLLTRMINFLRFRKAKRKAIKVRIRR